MSPIENWEAPPQKRVTVGRWRRIVLCHVLAEQVVRVEEVVFRVSDRRSSGSFGSDRIAGYAIGEGRTSRACLY